MSSTPNAITVVVPQPGSDLPAQLKTFAADPTSMRAAVEVALSDAACQIADAHTATNKRLETYTKRHADATQRLTKHRESCAKAYDGPILQAAKAAATAINELGKVASGKTDNENIVEALTRVQGFNEKDDTLRLTIGVIGYTYTVIVPATDEDRSIRAEIDAATKAIDVCKQELSRILGVRAQLPDYRRRMEAQLNRHILSQSEGGKAFLDTIAKVSFLPEEITSLATKQA